MSNDIAVLLADFIAAADVYTTAAGPVVTHDLICAAFALADEDAARGGQIRAILEQVSSLGLELMLAEKEP